VIVPALVFMRRSPEEMGLRPDGIDELMDPSATPIPRSEAAPVRHAAADERIWTWKEVLRTQTFWVICFIYGMTNVGIAGLNLHVFAYVTDLGFETIVAAAVMSIIASSQLGSTMVWGFVGERMEIRRASMLMFLIQSTGLALALAGGQVAALYGGFYFYGIGLGGSWVLQEIIWATFYGRVSLGMVRGFGILVTHAFGAAGAPFFGFIHDATGSYRSSFVAFTIALVASAFLSLAVRAPRQPAPQRSSKLVALPSAVDDAERLSIIESSCAHEILHPRFR
jgi:MFS family permease